MVTYKVIDTTQDNVTIDLDIDGEVSPVVLFGFHSDNSVLFDQEVRIYASGVQIGVEFSVDQVDDMIDTGLLTLVKQKLAEIDDKTTSLILAGLPFDGQVFDMDPLSQGNWTNMYYGVTTGIIPLPVEASTKDDKTYIFNDVQTVTQFYLTGIGTVQYTLSSGRAVKAQVNACTTIADLVLVIDSR